MAAARGLKHSNPEQLMGKMMEANPQFAAFVDQNKGKSPFCGNGCRGTANI